MAKRQLLVLAAIDGGFLHNKDYWGNDTRDVLKCIDGDPADVSAVVFGGGTDIDSNIYDELPGNQNQYPDTRRDKLEQLVFDWALRHNVPMIGVCRGAQLLTALNGGKLIQHVTGHAGGNHECITSDGEIILMNSCHHQMMFPWISRKDFKILAKTNVKRSMQYLGSGANDFFKEKNLPDIFVRTEFVEPEVVWWPDSKAFCVQGHPEWMPNTSTMVQWINESLENLIIRGKERSCSTNSEQAGV